MIQKKGGVSWQVILVLIAVLALVTGFVLLWFFSGKAEETLIAIANLFTFSWLAGGG